MIDQGGKSLSCSCMDGEGETSAHQSVGDADRSCMLTWQPRSRVTAPSSVAENESGHLLNATVK